MDSYPLHLADLTWTLAQEPTPDGAPAETTETTGGGDGKAPDADTQPSGGIHPLLLIGIPFLLLWIFVMGRGGNKAQKKKQAEMLAGMTKGSKIVTVGGIKGSVVEVRDDEVLVKVDESANTRLRFTRDAIRTVLSDDKTEQTDK